jgi:hypothetical protein
MATNERASNPSHCKLRNSKNQAIFISRYRKERTETPQMQTRRYAIDIEAIDITTILIIWTHTPHRIRLLKAAVADSNLGVLSLNAAESLSLTVCKVIHGRFGEVETIAGVVDSKNIYSLAVVGHTVAGTALG